MQGKEDYHNFVCGKIRDRLADVLFNALLQAAGCATNVPSTIVPYKLVDNIVTMMEISTSFLVVGKSCQVVKTTRDLTASSIIVGLP